MLQHSEQINEIATALAKAQAKMKGATKDSTNPHFKHTYADLESHIEACREALTENGIATIQAPGFDGDKVTVTTMLAHSSGQWLRDELSARPAKADPQGIGSAITYLRRYALSALAGTAPKGEDDDGNASSGKMTDGEREAFDTHSRPQPARPTRQTATETPPDDLDREYRRSQGHVETDETTGSTEKAAVDWFVPTPKKVAEAAAYAKALGGKANLIKTQADLEDFLAANHDGFGRLANSAKTLYDGVNAQLQKIRGQLEPNSIAA